MSQAIANPTTIKITKDLFDFGKDPREYAEIFNGFLEEYQKLIRSKFERFNQSLQLQFPSACESLNSVWGQFSPIEQDKLLLSPQIFNMFRWHRKDKTEMAVKFLLTALHAELAKKERKIDLQLHQALWTSNGDYYIKYNSTTQQFEEFESPQLSTGITCDFFSPYGTNITDTNDILKDVNKVYSYSEAEEVYTHANDALIDLSHQPNNVNYFISKILNVIVFKKRDQESGKRHFICGSNYNYFGRLLIVNGELAKKEEIVDSLVHETIHFVLDMIDELGHWIPTEINTNEQKYSFNSKWSGRELSMRTFLHAVFVWYGLFKLWVFAQGNRLYDSNYCIDRINYIQRGFEKLSLSELKATEIPFSKELMETFSEMKDEVLTFKTNR